MPRDAMAGVYLGDRRVGTLGYRDGNTWFGYEDTAADHPVLGQAFEIDPDHRRTASGRVPEWFANLLPEPGSGLRELIARELGVKRLHDFVLLLRLGADLPGAVRVVLEEDPGEIPELPDDTTCAHDHPLRFSLAGVQPKFSMRYEGKGLVLPVSGQGGDWIVKLPDRRFPQVPENEYTMLTWAGLSGIDVPERRLVTGGELGGLPEGLINDEEHALAVRRFDRRDGGRVRVHQEDFAQVREASVDLKYANATYGGLGRIVRVLSPQDVDEYLRRLVAIVVMGNLDAHLKNWTLTYPDGRAARLSPAYDLVAVAAYPEFKEDRLAFGLGGGQLARLITEDHFSRLAATIGLDPDHALSVVTSMIKRMADTWSEVRATGMVPRFVVDAIHRRLTGLPLMRGL
jgi:serine/threonine-protein kinase HipA